jgi:peptidyl-prolyl cis-trans isomerase D
MLGIMRKYKQSIVIKLVFGIIVFSFIGTIFLVWGRGEKGMAGSDYAARVGKMKITLDEYQKSYYRLRNMYEQIYGKSLTPELEKQLGLKKAALDSLVDNALVRKEGERMGISVTKAEIEKEIDGIPAFQRNGAFDFQQYQQTLKASRIAPSAFEDSVREDLLIKKTRQKVQEKATVSDDEALQAFRKQNDKINILFTSFAPADVKGEVKLTEQDLNSYLQGHQEQFKTPEQISLSYVVVDPARVAAKVTVSDEEAQAYYQKNIDRYQGKEGILPYAEVKERVKADALRFKAGKEAYELAADALNKNLKTADLNAVAAAVGAKVSEAPLFTAATPAAQLAGETEVIKRAFALKQGELGGPVETHRGIYILKLKERQAAAVPPLAQIKGKVEALAAEEKARELAKKKAEEALAQLGKGNAALKLQETGSFGYSAKGDIPKMSAAPEIMEAAFALTTAAPLPKGPFKVGERWYAIKLKERVELNKEQFAKAKEELKKSLLPKKQQEALAAWMKELKEKTKVEINPGLLAD